MRSHARASGPSRRGIVRLGGLGFVLPLVVVFVGALAPGAGATINTGASALDMANSMKASGSSFVTGASWVTQPPGSEGNPATPDAVSTTSLASFPTDGSSYGIMTSGDATLASDSNQDDEAAIEDNGGPRPGESTDFPSDNDVSILKVDLSVPEQDNCLQVNFRFLSEEFPTFVGSTYNDAFIAELDNNSWSTNGSEISAPDNFAFDADHNVVSINSSGVAQMSATNAAGTIYNGATPLLSAQTPVTPGSHSVYFSIFDQGDQTLDSAVFLDNLTLGAQQGDACQAGVQLAALTAQIAADSSIAPAGGTDGYTVTIHNPNSQGVTLNSISAVLPAGFSYTGGSTTGATTADPSFDSETQTATWNGPFTDPSKASLSLHFGVGVSDQVGQYTASASADASGVSVTPSGPSAPVMVVNPCFGSAPTLQGTGKAESLVGTAAADVIAGGAGREYLKGLPGNDKLCGGDGGDFIYGGDGSDHVSAGVGNDRLFGGAGNDGLTGGAGHDAIFAGTGTDTINANDGTQDCIVATIGTDTIHKDSSDLVNPDGGCPAGFWLPAGSAR